MKADKYLLRKLSDGDRIPFHLLLLADETEVAIKKYLDDCEVYALYIAPDTHPIGVLALHRPNDQQIEIKNMAIAEPFRGKGKGSYLIEKVKEIALRDNVEEIIVGTADTGEREIRFYEKNGFKRYGLKKDFFIENYPAPIIENGVMLRDMIMLKVELP